MVTPLVDTSRAEFDLVSCKCESLNCDRSCFTFHLSKNSYLLLYFLPGWGCVTSKSKGIAR